MDKLTEYKNLCETAVKNQDQGALKKFLPALAGVMASGEFHCFVTELMKVPVDQRQDETFSLLMGHIDHFGTSHIQRVYSKILTRNNEAQLECFHKAVEAKSGPQIAQKFKTEVLLSKAIESRTTKYAIKAIKNGANIHARDTLGLSKYFCMALEFGHADMFAVLKDHDVKTRLPDYILSRHILELSSRDQLEVLNALFETGYFSWERDEVKNIIRETAYYGYYKNAHFYKTVDQLEERWDQRKKHLKFLANFKPGIRVHNLEMNYRREPGYMMNCFHGLALADRFNEAVDIAKKSKETFSLRQLFSKESKGNTVVDILGAHNSLKLLDDPELWYGAQKTYFNLVAQTPHIYRGQFNPQNMRRQFARMKMNKLKKPQGHIRRRPKP